jgi:dihydroorotate dehydrogenase
MVFGGFDLIRDINLGLIQHIKDDGYTNITEAIGADRK